MALYVCVSVKNCVICTGDRRYKTQTLSDRIKVVSDLAMTGFHMTLLALSKQVYSSVYSVINTCPDSAYAWSLPYL